MAARRNEPRGRGDRERGGQPVPGGPETPDSLNDSAGDEERLRQDMSFTVLPEVRDIPGQENITSAGIPGEMGDTTISSDDEEGIVAGRDILGDDDEVRIVMGTEADVTAEDLILLGDPGKDMDLGDDEQTDTAGLDDTDDEGELLNEMATDAFTTGDDLDVPVADTNNPALEETGEGDEENDYYSLGSEDNDNITEGTP